MHPGPLRSHIWSMLPAFSFSHAHGCLPCSLGIALPDSAPLEYGGDAFSNHLERGVYHVHIACITTVTKQMSCHHNDIQTRVLHASEALAQCMKAFVTVMYHQAAGLGGASSRGSSSVELLGDCYPATAPATAPCVRCCHAPIRLKCIVQARCDEVRWQDVL